MNQAVVARRAESADIDVLVALRSEMFHTMGMDVEAGSWQESARAWFHDRIDSERCGFFIIEADSAPVACGVGLIRDAIPMPGMDDDRDILISNICTFSDQRGRGYGNLAFEAVMDWARSTGVKRLELMATPAGQRIYERFGFALNQAPAMRLRLDDTELRG